MAENVVARVFIGRPHEVKAQIRDHSNIARAYAALGKAGIDEVNRLVLQGAHHFGFVDEGSLSADTTAQELPIGYPNEPGILRGLAQRCGRALAQLKKRGIQGLDSALDQVQTILRSVKAHHLFTTGKADKRQVLTRILREVGELMVHTRGLVERLATPLDRVIQSARSRLIAMHEVIKPLMGQIVHWLTTGKVAANKIVHVGIPQARAIVRNKAGKKTEFGLAYLISRLGRRVSVWRTNRGQCGRKADAAQSPGGLSGHLWSTGDTGVGGLRPRWRFDANAPAARTRRRAGCRHSTQRETALVGCRGRPGADSQRARSHRRMHRDFKKQPIQIQQAQRTSLAHAGDGGAKVYLVMQSEQIDAGCRGSDPLRDRQKRTERRHHREEIQREKKEMEDRMTSNEFCDTL